MDPATASIIAAIISAVASVAVALITTRARIGVPSRPQHDPVAIPATPPRSVQIFRALGWSLVGFLYLMGVFFIFGNFLVHGPGIEFMIPEIDWTVLLAIMFGVFCILSGYWASKRLRRRGQLPQSKLRHDRFFDFRRQPNMNWKCDVP